jgi:cytochrome P450
MESVLNEFNLLDNPYPYYSEIRALKDPIFLKHDTGTLSEGIWLFGRYHDAVEIFKETTKISTNVSAVRTPLFSTPFDKAMLMQDGADHLRLRRLVSSYFSTKYINRLESDVALISDRLITAFLKKSDIDLVSDFSEPLPLEIIAHMVGIPETDIPFIRSRSLMFAKGIDSYVAHETKQESRSATIDFANYLTHLIAWRKNHLDERADDLLSFLVQAERMGTISYDELISVVGFTLFAGHETTVNLIGNGLWLLLNNRDQWALLQRKPSLMSKALEEILRFESPQQRTSFRITKEPVEIAGRRFSPGEQLSVLIGSANRDETVFSDANCFNIQRSQNHHLAFGHGLHNCLGKHLARLEAKVAITKILQRCPDIRLQNTEATWRKLSFFRGLAELPARL